MRATEGNVVVTFLLLLLCVVALTGPGQVWARFVDGFFPVVAACCAAAALGFLGVHCQLRRKRTWSLLTAEAAVLGYVCMLGLAPIVAKVHLVWFSGTSWAGTALEGLVATLLAVAGAASMLYVPHRLTERLAVLLALVLLWACVPLAEAHTETVQNLLVCGAQVRTPGASVAWALLAVVVGGGLALSGERVLRAGLTPEGRGTGAHLLGLSTAAVVAGAVYLVGLGATMAWLLLLPYAASFGGGTLAAAVRRSALHGVGLCLISALVAPVVGVGFGAVTAACTLMLCLLLRVAGEGNG